MSRIARYSPLLIGTAALVWALGTDPVHIDVGQVEREYRRTQAMVDLALAEIQLEASDGTITPEAAQSQIDEWVNAHSPLLQEQAQRAATLDRLAPLAQDAAVRPASAEDATPLSPAQLRIRELDSLQAQKVKALFAKAGTIEELQDRVDAWSRTPAGAAILDEREVLVRQVALAQPVGTQPIILQAPDHARPQEIEALDFQENIARRIQAIRQRHPEASVEEMQTLVDGDKLYFEQNMTEIQSRLKSAGHEALAEQVQRLKGLASPSAEPPTDSPPIAR